MDVDFWASKVYPSRNFSVVHAARFNCTDDSEDEDSRVCFPCPFSYAEIELSVFCSHLQEEHCFDVKNAICPLCAGNLGKDLIGHFAVQHRSSLKEKHQSSGFWDVGSRRRSLSTNGRTKDSLPDPLLICHIPFTKPEIVQQEECPSSGAITSNSKSDDSSSSLDEGVELDTEERKQRVEFVQQLMASMIL